MGVLLTPKAGPIARKAALRAACTPPSPLRRCPASSLTTPPHLRFEEVVRERGRRGAQGKWVMVGGKGNSGIKRQGQAAGRSVLEVRKSSGLAGVEGAGAEDLGRADVGKFVGAVSGLGGLRSDEE